MAVTIPTRSPAKRVFAGELREVTKTFKKDTDKKAPLYALLPTGEACNRVFIAGIMMSRVRDEKGAWVRAQIMDPSGTFSVSAGAEFQPEAKLMLNRIDPSNLTYVAVVGAPRTYTSEKSGELAVSVDARKVYTISASQYLQWVQDAAAATVARVKALNAAEPTDDALDALETYTEHDSIYWLHMVRDILTRLQYTQVPNKQATL